MQSAPAASSSPTDTMETVKGPWIDDISGSVALLLAEINKLRPGSEGSDAMKFLEKLIPDEPLRTRFLHRYAVARGGRFSDAAERILHFCDLLKDFPHLTIDSSDADVKLALGLGFLRAYPLRRNEFLGGALQIAIAPDKLDWDVVHDRVETVQKAWFFSVFVLLMQDGFPAQLHGIVGQGDMENVCLKNIKVAFHHFMMRALCQCLPVRVRLMVMKSVPFMMKGVILPVMKIGLSQKIYSRMLLVSEKDEVEKAIGTSAGHRELLSDAFPGGQWSPQAFPTAVELSCVSTVTAAAAMR